MRWKRPGATARRFSGTAGSREPFTFAAVGCLTSCSTRSDAVTQDEWDRCGDPTTMLEFVRTSGLTGDRKLRLFAVACCREMGGSLSDRRIGRAVEVAEHYADGRARRGELD